MGSQRRVRALHGKLGWLRGKVATGQALVGRHSVCGASASFRRHVTQVVHSIPFPRVRTLPNDACTKFTQPLSSGLSLLAPPHRPRVSLTFSAACAPTRVFARVCAMLTKSFP